VCVWSVDGDLRGDSRYERSCHLLTWLPNLHTDGTPAILVYISFVTKGYNCKESVRVKSFLSHVGP